MLAIRLSEFLLLCTLCTLCNVAFARDDLIPGSRYTSARAAAMGDAALPFGDDAASGVFNNPAGIAKIQSFRVEPLSLIANLDAKAVQVTGLGFTSIASSLTQYLPNLSKAQGALQGGGFTALSSVAFPGIAFSILYDLESEAVDNGDGTITNRSRYQFIPAAGVGFRFFRGAVRLGYSAQLVNQASGGQTLPSDDPTLAYNGGLVQGSALSHTLGLAVSLPVLLRPTIDFVARNFNGTSYSDTTLMKFSDAPVGIPPMDQPTYDASLSFIGHLQGGAILNLAMVGRDLTNVTNVSQMSHVAVGGELNIKNKIFVRGGWAGGYFSTGIGFKGKTAELNLSWYSIEAGNAYLGYQDIRYMIEYQMRSF